jgi:hypothetical protein
MAKQTLDFKGPFHFEKINNDMNLKNELSGKGIYIWGFVFPIDINGINNLGEPVDFKINKKEFDNTKWKFIPYYVGLADKTSLMGRLFTHHEINKGVGLKYMRMDDKYYRKFFSDTDFKEYTGNKNKQIQDLKNLINNNKNIRKTISYFNNAEIMELVDPLLEIKKKDSNRKSIIELLKVNMDFKGLIEIKDIPISEYFKPNVPQAIDDTLLKLVDVSEKNNFWFCYCALNNPDKTHEAFTFYSLLGKTISKTLNYDTDLFNNWGYKINANSIFRGSHSDDFSIGY